MLTVALVCVPGGIYNQEHVYRLIEQVQDHLTIPHCFYILASSDKPGWWAKVDLFEPGVFKDRVLYLDLDTTIVGSLDDIVNIDASFAAIKDYQYPMTLNSSVMVWDAGAGDIIFNDFTPEVMKKYRGDQNWIYNRIPAARRFPGDWCVSYRLTKGRVPKDARIIIYHGSPKPWDI